MPGQNEYQDFLKRGTEAKPDEYTEALKDNDAAEETVLRGSLKAASNTDPDRAARVIDFANKLNLPKGTVDRNLETIEKRVQLESSDYQTFLKDMPVLTNWVTESPDNAEVARDDLDQLGTIEALTTAFSEGIRHGKQTTQLGRMGFEMAAGDRSPELIKQVERVRRDLSITPGGTGFSAEWVFPAAKFIGQMIESGTRALETGFAGGSAGAAAAAVGGQVGPQVATPEEIITVPAAASLGFSAGFGSGFMTDIFMVEGGHAYLELSQIRAEGGEQIPESTRRAGAAFVGITNAALEVTGIRLVAAPWAAAAKKFFREGTKQALLKPRVRAAAAAFGANYAKAVAGEVTTEVLQETTNILVEEIAKFASEGDFETLMNSPDERDAAIERLLGIASETFRGMALIGLPGATVNLTADIRNVARAKKNEEYFAALGEGVAGSKLTTRMPEKLQELVGRMTQDGPVENLYIPIDAWTTYFQSVNIDPAQAAKEVLEDGAQYEEAVRTGEDLQIPTGRYAAKIAGGEHHAALQADMRLAPDQMTPREAKTFLADLEQQDAENLEQADSIDAVRQDVFGQLLGIGYERSTAEAYADLYAATFRTLGERAGVDPRALYERYGLKIERPIPKLLQELNQQDAIDVLIDRLKKGDIPSDRDVYGPSLVDFLVKQGGLVEEGGELAARDAGKARRGLVREDGLALDAAAEQAVEAGYLAERDPNVLLESIGAELAGTPVFAKGQENVQQLEARTQMQELQNYLLELGIDLSQTDNAEIRRLFDVSAVEQEKVSRGTSEQTTHFQRIPKKVLGVNIAERVEKTPRQEGILEVAATEVGDPVVVDMGDGTLLGVIQSRKGKPPSTVYTIKLEDKSTVENIGQDRIQPVPELIQARREQKTFEQSKDGDKRGSITFGPNRQFNIELFEKADLTTFLHETGHFYLEVLADLSEQAPEGSQMRQDFQTVLDWMNVADRGKITGKQHELWARTFEAYLKDGKAPSAGLRAIFARFKTWLVAIYRTFRRLDADLTPEVRGVMDRIVATEEEIAAAENEADVLPLFTNSVTAGMNETEFEAYRLDVEEAHIKAREELEAKLFEQEQREQQKWWKQARNKLRKEITEQVNSRPEYIAASILGNGKMPDGTELAESLKGMKLDRQAIVDMLGNDFLASLPKPFVYKKEGGVHPDVAAEAIGYPSGEQMLLALSGLRPRKALIEAETSVRMREQFGDLRFDDAAMKLAARQAVLGEARAKVVAAELLALRRAARVPPATRVRQRVRQAEDDRLRAEHGRRVAVEGQEQAEADAQAARTGERQANEALAQAQESEREARSDRLQAITQLGREQRQQAQTAREAAARRRGDQRSGLQTIRGTKLPIGQMKQIAQGMIAQKRIRDINPNSHLIAIRRSAREAVEAAAKDDFNVAAMAKQRELLNIELYRESLRAREEADKIADKMRRFEKTSVRARLGKAGADYLQQVDELVNRFEFRRVPLRRLDRRDSLADWIKQKEESGETMGEEVSIPEKIRNESVRTNYKNLTFDELQGLNDAIKQIEHFASFKNRLISDINKRERAEVKQELINAIMSNVGRKGPPSLTKAGLTPAQAAASKLKAVDASLLKMEQIVDWLDGGNLEGPWHRYLFDGTSEAQAAENDMSKAITLKIATAVMNVPKQIRKRLLERVSIPGNDRAMTRKDIIGVALNVGNLSNYEKLKSGMGWTDSLIEQMLSRMTKQEWDFVQSIWDTLESMWPDIAKLQKELTGLEPPKIEIKPVPTRFGTYRGGYYPVMYDPLASEQGQLQLASTIGNLTESTYTRATTPRGHTKARIEGFARPFDLDIDNLTGHIAGVIKDLTHRKWLVDANWIVNDKEIRSTLRAHLGDEYVPIFPDWVRSVVNDRNFNSLRSLGIWRRGIEHLRFNVLVAAMGFKATTMASQIAGMGPAIEVIGGKEGDGMKYFRRGFVTFMSRPFESVKTMQELSGEMRHRIQNRDRDLRDKLRLLQGRTDFLSQVQDISLRGIGYAEMLVSAPAWYGAFYKALDQGKTQEAAIRAGERAVRLSQGSGGAKDLAAVSARNDTFMRLITMFYTPFNAMYNRVRTVSRDMNGIKDAPQAAVRLWWVWLLPAIMGEILAGHGPDEDEDKLTWGLKSIAIYLSLGVPLVRDIVSGSLGEFGFQLSPIAQVGETVASTVKKSGKVLAGDAEAEELIKPLLKSTGFLLGLPTGQLIITGEYLRDLSTGEDEADNIADFAHDMLYRRRDR